MAKDQCLHKGFHCENCGYVDYSVMYASDPPQYKCEKFGCLVYVTGGDEDAEEQTPEQKA